MVRGLHLGLPCRQHFGVGFRGRLPINGRCCSVQHADLGEQHRTSLVQRDSVDSACAGNRPDRSQRHLAGRGFAWRCERSHPICQQRTRQPSLPSQPQPDLPGGHRPLARCRRQQPDARGWRHAVGHQPTPSQRSNQHGFLVVLVGHQPNPMGDVCFTHDADDSNDLCGLQRHH